MSGCLSRDAILSCRDLTIERCEVPEWGGHVFVMTMTARAKEAFENECLRNRTDDGMTNMGHVRARLAADTICDESGKLMFTLKDVEALNEKSVKALDRVFELSQQLNRISKADVDELTKNSESTPDAASPSA